MKKALIFVGFLLLIGCEISQKNTAVFSENNVDPIVYFCPNNNCEKQLVRLINASNEYVHCALFDLKLDNVIKVLAKKSHDVDVKVVIDDKNYKEQIKGSGIRLDTSSQLSHNKFCVVDDWIVWTGSFNPTERGNFYNNNNVIVLYSSYLASNYEDEFSELWNGTFGNGNKVEYPIVYINNKKIENYFCPEDNCAEQVISKIREAKHSI